MKKSKEIKRLRGEVNDLREALVELKPTDEVCVGDSWFQRDDLPRVLANYMRATSDAQSEAKRYAIRLEASEAKVARLRAALSDHD